MSRIIEFVGKRIRNYRMQMGISQEKLAELSGCHPTYIGQIERGEKNATLESVERIAVALGIPMSTLFEKLEDRTASSESIPLMCYEFMLSKTEAEQAHLYKLLLDADAYKNE